MTLMFPHVHRSWLLVGMAGALVSCVTPQTAVTPVTPPLTGFSPVSARDQVKYETRVAALASPARAESLSRSMTREAHVAGTDAQARSRDQFARILREAGISTEIGTYNVYMPHPTSVRLFRMTPDSTELSLAEGPMPGDSATFLPQPLVYNGYGAAGDVTGDVVYANYGLVEDYKSLDSLGISVRGKIVVARYGRSYRGVKAREAEKHGAAALIIYSDPADDGFTRGDVYPDGPMRPSQGVQRGSVYNDNGDPTTPEYASLSGTPRVPLSSTTLPRIPVIPTSYANAAELLRGVRDATPNLLPKGWQGGLPFRYHVGPGPVRARVTVVTDEATRGYKDIWNVLGTIRGSEFPDEVIVIGGHRDAWGPGAADNVSGTVSVLEAARTIATLVKEGYRPKRTIVFASWDGEEWGLLGSTEYVEQYATQLSKNGVAYFNQDMVAFGPSLGASGSPSLRPLFRQIARLVRMPGTRESVYDTWRKESKLASDTLEPEMDDPGGGSDFAGFYNHLGIPIVEWGFGGPQGIYHSSYDSFHWLSTYGDPGFKHHAAAGELGALLVMRMANADILPYDYVAYARAMRTLADSAGKSISQRGWTISIGTLSDAITRMEEAARRFEEARDKVLNRSKPLPAAVRKRANGHLLQVERAFVRPQGLRNRSWYRNVIYAADDDNGYANIGLPSVNEAIRAGDASLTASEIADLAARFNSAAKILMKAARSLR
jgi:N-acetylated-alpha-linked acidic dipeptidase